MKKIVVILTIVGLCLVGLAYYFSSESLRLIERKQEGDSFNESIEKQMIADRSAREELLFGNTVSYQSIDLSKPDHAKINLCMQHYGAKGELDAICLNNLLKVIVDDFGELAFLKATIGSCINYDNLVFDHRFLPDLLNKNTSLANRLTLGFLNRFRNPEHLRYAFDKHKGDLFKNTPKSLYQKIFEKQVNELLSTYKEIKDQKNKEAFFEDLYFKADSQNLHGQYWKYTFWKRREIEKTDRVIFTILNEIKQHYNQ
ncbi:MULTISPECIES: hypothetical protein [Flavobacteriaceae]|uniref:hypothetical protein n=1 Tax=Flavobacteriaceae TaxID=49546 RepID=UPI00234B7A0A|nr:hypothetical protein [Muricauda sp. SP22]MDC6363777.1 hypothetical protein [Muricauda sp. SP22]